MPVFLNQRGGDGISAKSLQSVFIVYVFISIMAVRHARDTVKNLCILNYFLNVRKKSIDIMRHLLVISTLYLCPLVRSFPLSYSTQNMSPPMRSIVFFFKSTNVQSNLCSFAKMVLILVSFIL